MDGLFSLVGNSFSLSQFTTNVDGDCTITSLTDLIEQVNANPNGKTAKLRQKKYSQIVIVTNGSGGACDAAGSGEPCVGNFEKCNVKGVRKTEGGSSGNFKNASVQTKCKETSIASVFVPALTSADIVAPPQPFVTITMKLKTKL